MPNLMQWIIAGVAFAMAGHSLASALWFPHWDIKWYSRSKLAHRETPMSISSRIATGTYFAYWGLGMLFGHLATATTEAVWVGGFFMLLIAVGVTNWRDKRNYEEF